MSWARKTRIGGGGNFLSDWGQNRLLTRAQAGTVSMANGELTQTATITAVDPARALLIWNSAGHDNPVLASAQTYVLLTNATTVTATREDSTGAITVGFTVLTANPSWFRSVQRGTVTIAAAGTSGTATVSAVSPTRSAVTILGSSNDSAANAQARIVLTNATTVTLSIDGGALGSDTTTAFQLVEYW
jgi:hypothetical protein